MRENRTDNLGFILETAHKRGPQRPVDQPRRERFLLARTAFAFKKAARNLAGGKGFFLIVDRQREKVQSRLLGLFGNGRAEDLRAAVGDHNGAIGLTGDLAGFHNERTSAPHHFLAMYFKHFFSFQRRPGPMPSCPYPEPYAPVFCSILLAHL